MNSFYGQFGTDNCIVKYFPKDYRGICIDVGMGEPINGSNTYHFESIGWKCLCIEPNKGYCFLGENIRSNILNVACSDHNEDDVDFEIFTINGNNQTAISSLKADERLVESHKSIINNIVKTKVNIRTLDEVLSQYSWIDKIDFISIDTENTELDVLKGFDINRWNPKLFVIENNFDEPFLGEYLKKFNYIRKERVGVNDFFIKK